MKHINKVAAYFDNELSEAEKQDFLKELEANPELKSEFEFQQQVVEGIQAARKAELKAMLDNVPVASVGTSSTSIIYKAILGGAATILVGTGIYWYYFSSNTPAESVQEPVTIEYTDKEQVVEIDNSDVNLEDNKIESQQNAHSEADNKRSSKVENKPSGTPKVNMPEMPDTDDGFASKTLPEESLEVPKTVRNASVNLNSKIDVEVKMKKKYDFHYQFASGKLVLYGDFDDSLFEVLELNVQDESTLYLFYKSNYYYLNDRSGEISELEAVKDEPLKEKLENLR